jgi:hypothetical protein
MTELTAHHWGPAIQAKQKKTSEELAAMIHHDLSQSEDCPQRGLKVTVYGLNPWNAMLTFGVDCGPYQTRPIYRPCLMQLLSG